MELPQPLRGEQLRKEVQQEPSRPKILIEGFLYEHSILMIHSLPGLGKSVLSTQAAAHLSNGSPLFFGLQITRPYQVYYIQMERNKSETLERLHYMEKEVSINYDNLCLDDQLRGINFINEVHANLVLARIEKFMPDVKVIIIDPIYAGVAGGLSKDEQASLFCRFVMRLQHKFTCAMWLNHHQHRERYSSDGSKIVESDAFYGSQWLKALVTGSFSMSDSVDGSILEAKKDSHGNLLSKLVLNYDPSTYLSALDVKSKDTPVKDRLLFVLRKLRDKQGLVTFKELKDEIEVSDSYLRNIIASTPFSEYLIKVKTNGRKTLYQIDPKL